MNPDWKNFLLSEQALIENSGDIVFNLSVHEANRHIYPVSYLGVLAVSGKDAATFLQGQITCNINDITDLKGCLGALCNPKGRAIATFLVVKNADALLMIMPVVLIATVKQRLQRYVLRAGVVLADMSNELCLIGLSAGTEQTAMPEDFAVSGQDTIVVNLPKYRRLIIAAPESARTFWLEQLIQGFLPGNSAAWRYLDILAGIPWLSETTSEAFIPQMLNLDKLGGISFNKGCYVGQEVVARTHYLGQAKREMYLAECDAEQIPEPNSSIIDAGGDAEQAVGKVLYAQRGESDCKMLIVLQMAEASASDLRLATHSQDKIRLSSL